MRPRVRIHRSFVDPEFLILAPTGFVAGTRRQIGRTDGLWLEAVDIACPTTSRYKSRLIVCFRAREFLLKANCL